MSDDNSFLSSCDVVPLFFFYILCPWLCFMIGFLVLACVDSKELCTQKLRLLSEILAPVFTQTKSD